MGSLLAQQASISFIIEWHEGERLASKSLFAHRLVSEFNLQRASLPVQVPLYNPWRMSYMDMRTFTLWLPVGVSLLGDQAGGEGLGEDGAGTVCLQTLLD